MVKAPIITVVSPKGGQGKTTLAYELAALFHAVLLDLDWDLGGATGMWGDDPENRVRSAVLHGLVSGDGPLPRVLHATGRPDLVPSDSRLAEISPDPAVVTDRLTTWASAWDRPLVVDTHPGTGSIADGAMSAASVVAVPVIIGSRELEALGGFLRRVGSTGLPLVIVPSRWRALKSEQRLLGMLTKWARGSGIPATPPVADYPWIPRRYRRGALVLVENPGAEVARAAENYRAVGRALLDVLRKEPDHE
ncbi:MAG TPA: ParA family protein [Candidatus Saccharimonadales bacterium]|nr:ParA family protein [Candidatus Saccharimonadales bacterium]